ncbi:MAG: type II restriction endonuclease [Bacteroidia bacterium]
MQDRVSIKANFLQELQVFTQTLNTYVSTPDKQWTVKGFIDIFENIYPISSDTKIISKILEIHLFSKILTFANKQGFDLILAEKQNWYPDISLISKNDTQIKFAIDIKTTYRLTENPSFCNGFTLGSHGEYFTNRSSTKNIQFPYNEYLGHYCLGILYSRNAFSYLEEAKIYSREMLHNIPSVIDNFDFFAQEKWRIASDKSGSGNTANIGSITHIQDIIQGNGVFSKLGERFFDEYWMNYGKIVSPDKLDKSGKPQVITNLVDYLRFKGKEDAWMSERIVTKKTTANLKSND